MAERLFFALWPDDSVRQAIADRLTGLSLSGTAVARQNWHITLAFLGNVDDDQRELYEQSANAIQAAPFELILDRLGYFYRARILWLGASRLPDPLIDFHAQLSTNLSDAGFKPDPRPWKAHMTLARKAPPPEPLSQPELLVWPVTSFRLVRSETRSDGARYHNVTEYLLTG